MKVVLVMFKDGERRDFPVTLEKTTMGRRPDCHLRVQTNDVSRQHCELVLNKAGLSVRDLGSSNGTFVNGKRIGDVFTDESFFPALLQIWLGPKPIDDSLKPVLLGTTPSNDNTASSNRSERF